MGQFKVVFRVFAVVGVLAVLPIGNASAQSCLCNPESLEQLEFTGWVPRSLLIIAGPGTGAQDATPIGFGSLAVYDAPIINGPDSRNSTEWGRCRGQLLVHSLDARNLLMFLTFEFHNLTLESHKFNGSLVVAGPMPFSGETFSVPILGGTEAFTSARGFIRVTPLDRPAGGWGSEIIDALMQCEFHVTVPKSMRNG